MGTVAYGQIEWFRGPVGRNTVDSEFSVNGVTALPRVDIIMAYENMDGALIDAAVAAGAKGVVIAGVGNGNLTKAAVDTLAKHAKAGIVCVRASRVATGYVGRNVELDDDKLGFLASLDLNPQKARVLLRLALLKQRPLKACGSSAPPRRTFMPTSFRGRGNLRIGSGRSCTSPTKARLTGNISLPTSTIHSSSRTEM